MLIPGSQGWCRVNNVYYDSLPSVYPHYCYKACLMETNEMKNSVPEEQPGEEFNTTGNVETPATSESSAEVSSEQPVKEAVKLQNEDHQDESVQDEHVDFSDEEASIASSALDDDESEEEEDPTPSHQQGTDYSGLSKPELVVALRDLIEANTASRIRKDIDAIKIAFYKRHKIDVRRSARLLLRAVVFLKNFNIP